MGEIDSFVFLQTHFLKTLVSAWPTQNISFSPESPSQLVSCFSPPHVSRLHLPHPPRHCHQSRQPPTIPMMPLPLQERGCPIPVHEGVIETQSRLKCREEEMPSPILVVALLLRPGDFLHAFLFRSQRRRESSELRMLAFSPFFYHWRLYSPT